MQQSRCLVYRLTLKSFVLLPLLLLLLSEIVGDLGSVERVRRPLFDELPESAFFLFLICSANLLRLDNLSLEVAFGLGLTPHRRKLVHEILHHALVLLQTLLLLPSHDRLAFGNLRGMVQERSDVVDLLMRIVFGFLIA